MPTFVVIAQVEAETQADAVDRLLRRPAMPHQVVAAEPGDTVKYEVTDELRGNAVE